MAKTSLNFLFIFWNKNFQVARIRSPGKKKHCFPRCWLTASFKNQKTVYKQACMYVCMYVYEYAYAFMVFVPRCSLLVSKIQRANSERQQFAGMRCGSTTQAARKSDACACEKLLFNYQLTRWVGVVWGQEESWWNLRPETHVMLTLTKGFDSRSRWYDSWQLPKYSLLINGIVLGTLLHPGLIEQLQVP